MKCLKRSIFHLVLVHHVLLVYAIVLPYRRTALQEPYATHNPFVHVTTGEGFPGSNNGLRLENVGLLRRSFGTADAGRFSQTIVHPRELTDITTHKQYYTTQNEDNEDADLDYENFDSVFDSNDEDDEELSSNIEEKSIATANTKHGLYDDEKDALNSFLAYTKQQYRGLTGSSVHQHRTSDVDLAQLAGHNHIYSTTQGSNVGYRPFPAALPSDNQQLYQFSGSVSDQAHGPPLVQHHALTVPSGTLYRSGGHLLQGQQALPEHTYQPVYHQQTTTTNTRNGLLNQQQTGAGSFLLPHQLQQQQQQQQQIFTSQQLLHPKNVQILQNSQQQQQQQIAMQQEQMPQQLLLQHPFNYQQQQAALYPRYAGTQINPAPKVGLLSGFQQPSSPPGAFSKNTNLRNHLPLTSTRSWSQGNNVNPPTAAKQAPDVAPLGGYTHPGTSQLTVAGNRYINVMHTTTDGFSPVGGQQAMYNNFLLTQAPSSGSALYASNLNPGNQQGYGNRAGNKRFPNVAASSFDYGEGFGVL